jgi:hypothetical protein
VVRSEERRWIDVRKQVWKDEEPRALFEMRLWHHFELLQLWDLLSLFLCVVPDVPAPAAPPAPWGPQMAGVEHRSEAVRLPTVSPVVGGPRLDLVARVAASGQIHIDPFPFAGPVEVEIEVRNLPKREWTRAEAIGHLDQHRTLTKRWRVLPT